MDRNKIKEYYASEIEKNRLDLEVFILEGIRTKEIISRYLLKKKMNILDIVSPHIMAIATKLPASQVFIQN